MAILGYIVFYICGIIMWGLELYWFYQWWDIGGILIAIFIPPLAVIFPFIYLIKVGFASTYFIVWGLGVLSLIITSFISHQNK